MGERPEEVKKNTPEMNFKPNSEAPSCSMVTTGASLVYVLSHTMQKR